MFYSGCLVQNDIVQRYLLYIFSYCLSESINFFLTAGLSPSSFDIGWKELGKSKHGIMKCIAQVTGEYVKKQ